MVALITKNKQLANYVKMTFSSPEIDFMVIDTLVCLFIYLQELKNATIVMDIKSLQFKEIIDELATANPSLQNAIKLNPAKLYIKGKNDVINEPYIRRKMAKAEKIDAQKGQVFSMENVLLALKKCRERNNDDFGNIKNN